MSVLRILSAVAVLALASPAVAQSVADVGPYSPVDGNDQMMVIAAEGTASKTGSIGRITTISLTSPAARTEMGFDLARLYSAYEFECGGANFRIVGTTAIDSTGAVLLDHADPTEWEAVGPQSPNDTVRALVCDGARTTDTPAPTIEAMEDFYRLWLAGEFED